MTEQRPISDQPPQVYDALIDGILPPHRAFPYDAVGQQAQRVEADGMPEPASFDEPSATSVQ